ncbi:MAG: hypothetical protein ACE5KO_01305 [Candidatus Bathyarchaeia archaeon]
MSIENLLKLFDDLVEGGKCKRLVRVLVAYMNITENAQRLMEGWDCVTQLALNGEEPFYVRISGGQASLHEGLAEKPHLLLQGESELMYKVLSGAVDPDEAMLWFSLKGAVADGLKFRRITEAALKPHMNAIVVLRRLMP